MTEREKSWTYCIGSWTEQRIETLINLRAEGLSAQQIADRLGGTTRNAVIGKSNRLGLKCQTSHTYSPKSRKKRRLGPRQPPRVKFAGSWAFRNLILGDAEPWIPSTEELVIPLAERKSLDTLEENHCRWPIGDPKADADFHFCGKDKVTGLSYCEHHVRRAYQPPQPRKIDAPRMPRDFAEPMVAWRQPHLA